jgi:DNA adenine methylase Dam
MPELIKYFPQNVKLYDLFCGGGSVFINSQFHSIHANDKIKPLIEFYQFLQSTPWEEVIARIEERNIPKDNQETYVELRKRYNNSQDFIDFFILVCTCTNNMMRFNKKFEFNQTWGKRNFNDSTRKKLKAYHDRLYGSNITFSNKDFFECPVEDGFVYLDPPYSLSEAGYNAYWSKALEERLYVFLDELNNRGIKFMLSNVAEHKGVKNPHLDKIKKYTVIDLNFDYNKVSRNGDSNSKEIIVINYLI